MISFPVLTLQEKFVNVANASLPLEEGERYHVCIYAEETGVEFEDCTKHLYTVSVYSNFIPFSHLLLLFQENFVNVANLSLEEGRSYRVCICAEETDLEFEVFTKHLDTVSVYSNFIPFSHLLLLFQENFVNVANLSLEEGRSYHVCICAEETDVEFQVFTKHLDTVSVYSNFIPFSHFASCISGKLCECGQLAPGRREALSCVHLC